MTRFVGAVTKMALLALCFHRRRMKMEWKTEWTWRHEINSDTLFQVIWCLLIAFNLVGLFMFTFINFPTVQVLKQFLLQHYVMTGTIIISGIFMCYSFTQVRKNPFYPACNENDFISVGGSDLWHVDELRWFYTNKTNKCNKSSEWYCIWICPKTWWRAF